jgi:hypothetical protein
MNETEMAIAVEKMQTYVALAEDEIANRKKQCELMHKDLLTSRRLMESLQQKLRETEAKLVLQKELKRVSQFKMPKTESGGILEVCMVRRKAPEGESAKSTACHREGCCGIERLYLANGVTSSVIFYDCLQMYFCRKQ